MRTVIQRQSDRPTEVNGFPRSIDTVIWQISTQYGPATLVVASGHLYLPAPVAYTEVKLEDISQHVERLARLACSTALRFSDISPRNLRLSIHV